MNDLRKKQDLIFGELESANEVPKRSIVSHVDDFEKDGRLCLTFVYFLPPALRKAIGNQILMPLRKADPSQYFYPEDSLHITIQNVRVIANPPNYTLSDIRSLEKLSDFMKGCGVLNFSLAGFLRMPESIAIRAYPNHAASDFILRLRKKMDGIGVPDDKCYLDPRFVVGNVTFCRFYNKPNEKFLAALEKLKDVDFGKIEVDMISLLITNAVCYKERTKIIKRFKI